MNVVDAKVAYNYIYTYMKLVFVLFAGCYCGEDCGLYNNCCYEDQDIHRIFEKEDQTCLFPSTREAILFPLVNYTFYMVDKCPEVRVYYPCLGRREA